MTLKLECDGGQPVATGSGVGKELEPVEVAVVGGGIHGVSTAFHLVSRGAKTILFESAAPASGPTGRSSAVCRAFYTNAFLARVAQDSIEMFASFKDVSAGRDAGFHRTGALFLHGPEDEVQLRATANMLQAVGTEVQLLSSGQLAASHPGIDFAGVRLGVWEVGAGYADPVSTTQGLFERALELGLLSHLYCKVTKLESRSGGGAVITGSDGSRTECSRLLVAAGPWTRPLVRQLGIDLPLSVERHFVATFGWNRASAVPFVLVDVPAGYYMKPEGDRLFIVGSLTAENRADPDSFSHSVFPEEIHRMAAGVTSRVPALAAADSRGGWASLYDVSPDWQPVIGEVADGVFVDAGTSGHGFKLAPGLGRHIAGLVLGDQVDSGLSEFHPRRFDSKRLLAAGFGAARILG